VADRAESYGAIHETLLPAIQNEENVDTMDFSMIFTACCLPLLKALPLRENPDPSDMVQQGALSTGQECQMSGQQENMNLLCEKHEATVVGTVICMFYSTWRPLQRKTLLGCKFCSRQSVQSGVLYNRVRFGAQTQKELACRASAVARDIHSIRPHRLLPGRHGAGKECEEANT
jgi:hypothetical protein